MNDGRRTIGKDTRYRRQTGKRLQKFKETPINLEALFAGGNPFEEPADVQSAQESADDQADEDFANA
jgi:hypothetical protein